MNKLKTSLLVLLLAGFTAIPACGGEEDPTTNDEQDAGHDVGDDAGEDAGEDVGEDADANGENGGELKETGEACHSCAEQPGSMTACDVCEGERCYFPSTVNEDPYCTTTCNDHVDCADLGDSGWSCEPNGCVDPDRW